MVPTEVLRGRPEDASVLVRVAHHHHGKRERNENITLCYQISHKEIEKIVCQKHTEFLLHGTRVTSLISIKETENSGSDGRQVELESLHDGGANNCAANSCAV